MKLNTKKLIAGIAGIAAGAAIAFATPPEGLTVDSMRVFGIFVWAVVYWMFQVLPDIPVVLIMLGLWVALKAVPFNVAFAAFSGTTWWLILAVYGIGIAVGKSGLLKRISLMLMKLFPATFKGQVLGLLVTGTVVSPFIPSTSAKVTIAGPITVGVGDALGFAKQSRERAGLLSAAYTGFGLVGATFLSASFLSYVVLGMCPPEVAAQFTWMKWFMSMGVWGLVILVGMYFWLTLTYRPAKDEKVPITFIEEQIKELGPITRDEKITIVIMCLALALWITESVHGISATIIAIAAMSAFICTGVVGTVECFAKMNWQVSLLIGGIMGVAGAFPSVGIDSWLANTVGPYVSIFTSSPYIFVPVFSIFIYLVRFVILDIANSITLMPILVMPIAAAAGINQWIVGIIAYTCTFIWNTYYQNTQMMACHGSAGGNDVVLFNHTVKASVGYMIVNMLGLIASIPVWIGMGYIV